MWFHCLRFCLWLTQSQDIMIDWFTVRMSSSPVLKRQETGLEKEKKKWGDNWDTWPLSAHTDRQGGRLLWWSGDDDSGSIILQKQNQIVVQNMEVITAEKKKNWDCCNSGRAVQRLKRLLCFFNVVANVFMTGYGWKTGSLNSRI